MRLVYRKRLEKVVEGLKQADYQFNMGHWNHCAVAQYFNVCGNTRTFHKESSNANDGCPIYHSRKNGTFIGNFAIERWFGITNEQYWELFSSRNGCATKEQMIEKFVKFLQEN